MTDSWTWEQHQHWEGTWWGDCTNTFSEEAKQITYMHRIGMTVSPDLNRNDEVDWTDRWPSYDLAGRNVVDLGGGPVSPLLKCRRRGPLCDVVDPCAYPAWTQNRYQVAGIGSHREQAETFTSMIGYHEAWILNCLQHVEDPVAILENAKGLAPVVRLFEWVGYEPCAGHPHTITAEMVDGVLGERVQGAAREWIEENGAQGWATYGVWEVR